MTRDEQVRENRLRRAAERQGRTLIKSKVRDPEAEGYGTYTVSEGYYGAGGEGVTLDEAESLLIGEAKAEAMKRFQEVDDLWMSRGPVNAHLLAFDDNTMDIEVSVDELSQLAEALESGGMGLRTVAVRFSTREADGFEEIVEWLKSLPE